MLIISDKDKISIEHLVENVNPQKIIKVIESERFYEFLVECNSSLIHKFINKDGVVLLILKPFNIDDEEMEYLTFNSKLTQENNVYTIKGSFVDDDTDLINDYDDLYLSKIYFNRFDAIISINDNKVEIRLEMEFIEGMTPIFVQGLIARYFENVLMNIIERL